MVDKKTGEVLPRTYVAPAMFFFHTINAYEEGGSIIVDVASFKDASPIQTSMYMENLRKGEVGEEGFVPYTAPPIYRYSLPLTNQSEVKLDVLPSYI